MSEIVKGILRAVSSAMQIPTIIILILLILLAVVMLGSFVAEYFTERRTLKMNMIIGSQPTRITLLENLFRQKLFSYSCN